MGFLVVGTAGHIDHGKSALVKALTGTDPDRLAEEQQRGMTIDIGFAFLNENVAFIDVPGHERFVKNMVTGASTVDVAMVVIAADDGIMPQTREHIAILNLLGIRQGIIVINKIDLVETEWLELVVAEVQNLVQATFLANAPLFRVSVTTGAGIKELKKYLTDLPERFVRPTTTSLFRLPIDRVFSVRGHGTVVTGTIISGRVNVGDEVEVLPLTSICKVRGLQTQGQTVTCAAAGQRAALNLTGVERMVLTRGQVLATPDAFPTTRLLTVRIELLPGTSVLKYNDRVHLHLNTAEDLVRVRFIGRDSLSGGEQAIAQLSAEHLLSSGFRDRFILRNQSARQTIGGGLVLDPQPAPLRKKAVDDIKDLLELSQADLTAWIEWYLNQSGSNIVTREQLSRRFSATIRETETALEPLKESGRVVCTDDGYVAEAKIVKSKAVLLDYLTRFHGENPLAPGIEKAELLARVGLDESLTNWTIEMLLQVKILKLNADKIALADFNPRLSAHQQNLLIAIEQTLLSAGLTPPDLETLSTQFQISIEELHRLLTLLVLERRVVMVEKILPFHPQSLEKAAALIEKFLTEHKIATVSELKTLLGISRKFAVPLLAYFDQQGLTVRKGDERCLAGVSGNSRG